MDRQTDGQISRLLSGCLIVVSLWLSCVQKNGQTGGAAIKHRASDGRWQVRSPDTPPWPPSHSLCPLFLCQRTIQAACRLKHKAIKHLAAIKRCLVRGSALQSVNPHRALPANSSTFSQMCCFLMDRSLHSQLEESGSKNLGTKKTVCVRVCSFS